MKRASPVLELDAVQWPGGEPFRIRVDAGACVRLPLGVEDAVDARRMANVAAGISMPWRGRVRFDGEDWRDLPAAAAERRRACIGRVFSGAAWVSNLDVDENVLLGQLHHTARTRAALRAEAEQLARAFGMPALPTGRAAWLPARDLQRTQWVRALLGAPELLLLEFPERGVRAADRTALATAVDAARARGAGVLWIAERDPAAADSD